MLRIREEQLAALDTTFNRELLDWCVDQLRKRTDHAAEPPSGWPRWVHECIKGCHMRGIHDSESIYLFMLQRLEDDDSPSE